MQGLWAGVVNTTNVDMVNIYECSYDELNRATTMKSLGVMSGSFVGAAISDKFRRKADLFLALVCLVGGVTIALIPWSPSLAVMAAIFVVNGLCHGVTNVGNASMSSHSTSFDACSVTTLMTCTATVLFPLVSTLLVEHSVKAHRLFVVMTAVM